MYQFVMFLSHYPSTINTPTSYHGLWQAPYGNTLVMVGVSDASVGFNSKDLTISSVCACCELFSFIAQDVNQSLGMEESKGVCLYINMTITITQVS